MSQKTEKRQMMDQFVAILLLLCIVYSTVTLSENIILIWLIDWLERERERGERDPI